MEPPSKKRSEKFLEHREALPDVLQSIYDQFVDEYHFATIRIYGRGYVAYPVLAEMVRQGWRPSAEPIKGGPLP